MEQKEWAGTPLIHVENLKKYYPVKNDAILRTAAYAKAVDGVSFSIAKAETLGLVGESGCGKSTVGRLLVGLERPDGGTLSYRGRELADFLKENGRRARTKLQMVFQDSYSSLNPRKHIYEILAQPMLCHRIATKDTLHKELERLLSMVGLPQSVLGRYPHEFSGGQRQRIGIARALSLKPEFLICDEPVSALDVSVQAQILNLLRGLQKELQLTCLFIGHGLGAVKYVSDHIAVMYLGKIVETAPTEEIFQNPLHPYTRALCDAAPGGIEDRQTGRWETPLLNGEAGSNITLPTGCRFHPRCPYASAKCKEEEPVLTAADGTVRQVACWNME